MIGTLEILRQLYSMTGSTWMVEKIMTLFEKVKKIRAIDAAMHLPDKSIDHGLAAPSREL